MIRQAGREIWRSSIGVDASTQSVPISIANGQGTLDFATDIPPIRESAARDARLLAFALYDPRLVLSR